MDLMEKVVSLAKRRGFVFSGSDIYGGIANTYDYGPLGVSLKNNIKNLWLKQFVLDQDNIYPIDGGIILSPKVWEASGHVASFVDPLVECKSCHKRFREDYLKDKKVCPECKGELTEPKLFNGMFKTFLGATENKDAVTYLRPETAQAIFINFKNIIDSFHPKLPFGISQVGKAFRNEITAGNFIFRMLEFEQMEVEYFIHPKADWKKEFDRWLRAMQAYLVSLGVNPKRIIVREHDAKERSHYSQKTVDLEYEFPFGVKEVYGLAYRTDFDLKAHAKASNKSLEYIDSQTGEKIFPHVVEPSMGVDRSILVTLLESYHEDKERVYLSLPPEIAPYKVAVFPLLANKPDLTKKAWEIYQILKQKFPTVWDDRGNIGKRYFAQDEIGTPWCVTVDFDTLKDNAVTIRDRDTTKQERIQVEKIANWVEKRLEIKT